MRNGASLDRLVVDHLPAAVRFAVRLTGDRDRAEDIVQEALLRAVSRWTSFRGDAQFRTWLFRIVINVFRDSLRASSSGLSIVDELVMEAVDPISADPSQTAIAAELEEVVAREVSRLPPRQREVLVLIAYEGLSAREVAGVVGISESNVYATLSGARSRLKRRLAPHLGSVEK